MYLFLPSKRHNLACLSVFTFHNVSISTPTMVRNQLIKSLYIPQCIYFYLVTNLDGTIKSKLYIPQCIYFYAYSSQAYFTLFSFTFHNVSISTGAVKNGTLSINSFTFHNVSISTLLATSRFRPSTCLYIPQCIYFYSFQILCGRILLSLHSTMYLFLQWLCCFLKFLHILYIPQCIYFYVVPTICLRAFLCLYIPQCIYFYTSNISDDR